jgi:hypothetical protein
MNDTIRPIPSSAPPIDLPLGLPEEVAHALRLLEQEGPEALSLARVATRMGRGSDPVRAGLPWADERALRTDLAALGFHRLDTALREAREQGRHAGQGAADLLMLSGRAYIHTAVRSPALFALMRDAEAVDFNEPRLQAASSAALHALLDLVVELKVSGFEPDRSTEELSNVIWDSVHRLTMRWADAALAGPVDAATVDEAISLELTLLLLDGEPPQRIERAS